MRDVSVRYPERPEEGSNRMWTLNNHLTDEQRPRVAEWLHMLGVERASFTAVQDLSDVRIEFRRAAPAAPGAAPWPPAFFGAGEGSLADPIQNSNCLCGWERAYHRDMREQCDATRDAIEETDAALAVLAELVALENEPHPSCRTSEECYAWQDDSRRRHDVAWARARALVAGQGEEMP